MSTAPVAGGQSRNLVLAAMIFAVAMTFIDQTIVSIAVPEIQRELGLSNTGVQWAVNAYLLALAALFAFGGRLADTVGHRKMVVLGVIIFAGSSAMCGLTPKGSLAEAWIVVFRAVQGAGGAIMFPAALAIVVQTFALRERGKALAKFFGIAGGLTAVGPVLGGYLTEWTWRAIFWVNIPVAVIALVLIAISKPDTAHRPAPMDYRGLVLVGGGVGLSVFGFQQSFLWGWGNPGIALSIAAGVILLVAFVLVEMRTESPLIQVGIFRIRAFAIENIVLGIAMLVFIPVFFFSSEYGQISLGKSAQQVGVILLYFFVGFVITAQIGGRMLDRAGAKRPVVLGCALAAVGFYLWAGKVTQLNLNSQQWYIVLAGAGMGFMLGPASTDAVNRASQALLRRGDRHNPDRPELRRQHGTRDTRHDLGFTIPLQGDVVTDRAGNTPQVGGEDSCRHLPVPGAELERFEHHPDSSLHPTRFRVRVANRVLRDGRCDGRGGPRRVLRARAGTPG